MILNRGPGTKGIVCVQKKKENQKPIRIPSVLENRHLTGFRWRLLSQSHSRQSFMVGIRGGRGRVGYIAKSGYRSQGVLVQGKIY